MNTSLIRVLLSRRTAFAAILVASFFVQISLVRDTVNKVNINFYFIFLLLVFIANIRSIQRTPKNLVLLFFFSMTASTLLSIPKFGLGIRSTLLVFMFSAYFVGVAYGRRLTADDWPRIFIFTLLCCFIFAVYRNVFYFEQLGAIASRRGYIEDFLYMATGGRNIEATLLALLSILLIGSKGYRYALALALFTAALMQSRAGLIGCFASIFFYFQVDKVGRSRRVVILTTALPILLILAVLGASTMELTLLQRFNISEEVQLGDDDLGRLALWRYSAEAASQNWIGYGIGNAVSVLEEISGVRFVENNVHNIFLQVLLEGGAVSLILIVLFFLKIVFLKPKSLLEVNIRNFILCYGLLGFVQFQGYEVYFWFFVGVLFGVRAKNKRTKQLVLQ